MKPSRRPRSPRPARPAPSLRQPPPRPEPQRLQKLLAEAGLASRRAVEEWIAAGRVSVGGRVAKLGDRATREEEIAIDGRRVRLAPAAAAARVLLYHKPVGELVTRSDPGGRPTVFARLPAGRWIAVGRLDINTSGLLLLTDSGELANRLMHPRYGLQREYEVRVHGRLSPDALERLAAGVALDDGPAAFESIRPRGPDTGHASNRWYVVTLREGRNREVRRLFEAVGARVSRLVRVRYGRVRLPEDLAPGRWKELAPERAEELFAS